MVSNVVSSLLRGRDESPNFALSTENKRSQDCEDTTFNLTI